MVEPPGTAPGPIRLLHAFITIVQRTIYYAIIYFFQVLPMTNISIDFHGSLLWRALPFCNNSIEILSGERINAILPSRGGRFIITPAFVIFHKFDKYFLPQTQDDQNFFPLCNFH